MEKASLIVGLTMLDLIPAAQTAEAPTPPRCRWHSLILPGEALSVMADFVN